MTKISPTPPRSPDESSSGLIMSNAAYFNSVMSNINTLLNGLRNTQNTARQKMQQLNLELTKIAADQTIEAGKIEQSKCYTMAYSSIASCAGSIIQAGGYLLANAAASRRIDREYQTKIRGINSDLAKLENPAQYAPAAVMTTKQGQTQVTPASRADIEAKIRNGTLGPLTDQEIACLSQKGNADLKAQVVRHLENEKGKIDQLIADKKHSEQRKYDNMLKIVDILSQFAGIGFKMKEGELAANKATVEALEKTLVQTAQVLAQQASASGEQASNMQQNIEKNFSTSEKLISSFQFR